MQGSLYLERSIQNFKNKKPFRKHTCKGQSVQQRFNITSSKTRISPVVFCKASFPTGHDSHSYREHYGCILREESKNLDKIFKNSFLREWPSKTTQWIKSELKCYWLELIVAEKQEERVFPGQGQDQTSGQMPTSVLASLTVMAPFLYLGLGRGDSPRGSEM